VSAAAPGDGPGPRVIAIGERAPDFTLPDQDRKDWTLSTALRSGPVVLCFYPFDFSSVCGSEMGCVRDWAGRWRGTGAQAVGISCDSTYAHRAWARELGLEHPLLADAHRVVCRAYGLYWAERNVAARGTVVVAPDGLVAWSEGRAPGCAMDMATVLERLEQARGGGR